jgi:hypothetical protein
LLQQAIDQRGLAVVDVGDNGDVTKVHGSSSGRAKVNARSHRNRDPLFRIALLKPGIPARDDVSSNRHPAPSILLSMTGSWLRGAFPQKGNPAKRTGHTLRVAAQYIQKTPKNNGLFGTWLADFAHQGRLIALVGVGIDPP